MHLSTHSLGIFLSVVEHGSLSKAARTKYMSQPSVSAQIRSLETALGTHLLERSHTGVTPTAAGRVLAARAAEILSVIGGIEAEVSAAQGLVDSRLAVAATSTLGSYLVPQMLARFTADHPSVRVELRVGNAEQVIQWVIDREATVGLAAGRIDHPQLRSTPFLDEAIVAAAAPDHPLALAQEERELHLQDLRGHRFLMREIGSATRSVQESTLAAWKLAEAEQWTIWGAEGARECARAGLGIVLVSEHVIAQDLEFGTLRALRIDPPPPRRPVTALRPAGVRLTDLEAQFTTAFTGLEAWPAA